MNIEIANKLLQLRKEKGLSQEQLVQKLGISRQAISKWERGEASPDTDNLIELAKLYDISLDELLLHEPTNKQETEEENYAHVGWDGIHVKEKDGDEVHVSWDGIHVHDKQDNQVNIDKHGVYVNGKKYDKEDFKQYHHNNVDFPIGMLFILIYIIYGLCTNIWHPTWIIILIWPTISGLRDCIRKRRVSSFPYPIICTVVFLAIVFLRGIWHPTWVIFLTIPCFYGIAHYIDHKKL